MSEPVDAPEATPDDRSMTEAGPAMARLLLAAGSIQVSHRHPFILTAGWASPVYVDCRRLLGSPELRRAATDLCMAHLRRLFGAAPPFDAVAGGETAGIPWATMIADRLDLPMLYVRKRPLGIGRLAQVEGGSPDGKRVLLVDDLATDASSKVAFARGLRNAGLRPADLLVLFHNRAFPGWQRNLEAADLPMHALAGWHDVLQLEGETGALEPANRILIERFLEDPVQWSADHGGRSSR